MHMFMEVCKREREGEKLLILILYSDCSLNCGNNASRCLNTKIPNLPEICACSDGTFTNSTCRDIEEEISNITSTDIHGLRE